MAIKIDKKQVKKIKAKCIKVPDDMPINYKIDKNKIYIFEKIKQTNKYIIVNNNPGYVFSEDRFYKYFQIIKPEPTSTIDDIIKVIHRQAGVLKGIKNGLVCAKKQGLLDDIAINRLEHSTNNFKYAYNELIEYMEGL